MRPRSRNWQLETRNQQLEAHIIVIECRRRVRNVARCGLQVHGRGVGRRRGGGRWKGRRGGELAARLAGEGGGPPFAGVVGGTLAIGNAAEDAFFLAQVLLLLQLVKVLTANPGGTASWSWTSSTQKNFDDREYSVALAVLRVR